MVCAAVQLRLDSQITPPDLMLRFLRIKYTQLYNHSEILLKQSEILHRD